MSTPGQGINDRIKSKNGIEKELTTGIPYDGTVDPTGENPRRTNWFGVSTSQAQRGVKINSLALGGGSWGVNFDVSVPAASIYPYNNAFESLSGHSFEIDDTPGNERILIKHHSGAGIEVQPNGSIVIVSKGKSVHVSNGEYNMAVSGSGNITYDGDLNMNVNGNYNLKVNGTYNLEAGNSMNMQIHDSLITEVGDTHQTLVRGNKDVKVYGDTLDFHVGERKIVTKKDLRIIPKRDFIVNSKRHIRFTAEEFLTAATGKLLSLSSERMNIQGRKGKIGGDNFHFLGTLFTGPSGDKGDPRNDQGQKTVFHGNLIGRALESWTSKYAINAREAHSAHISNFASVASHADTAGNASRASYAVQALQAAAVIPIPPLPVPVPDLYPDWIEGETWEGADGDIVGANKPDYKFKWGWNVEDNTAYEQPLNVIENYEWDGKGEKTAIDPIPIAPFYTTNEDWFEVWNKTSPFAVRKVYVDEDDGIENKLYKPNIYSHYFHHTPDTAEIRAKLRTMDQANDPKTCPEMQCDHDKAEAELVSEGRLSSKYLARNPPGPYKIKRKGTSEPIARFGHTPLGNPKEKFL